MERKKPFFLKSAAARTFTKSADVNGKTNSYPLLLNGEKLPAVVLPVDFGKTVARQLKKLDEAKGATVSELEMMLSQRLVAKSHVG